MEKIILKVEEGYINSLTSELQNNVFPAVSKITTKLIELGITDDIKQRVSEMFGGDYSGVSEAYKANLEKDADNFSTPSAKENVLAQLNGVIAEFKELAKDAINSIGFADVDGIKLNSPEVLNYLEVNKKGEPTLTKENKETIKERFTIYVSSELGTEFMAKHKAFVKAISELYNFCKENNIGAFLPVRTSFYEVNRETEKIQATFINYDKIIVDSLPEQEVINPKDDIVVSSPRSENTYKNISTDKNRDKRINKDIY